MFTTIQVWAFKEMLRQPVESVLVALTLTLTIAITGTLLLFPKAMYDSLEIVLEKTPAIIVRQVDTTGWRPIPMESAITAARNVIGVVSVKPRIWGVVRGPDGPLTVMGVQTGTTALPFELDESGLPDKGQVVIGPGVSTDDLKQTLNITGLDSGSFRIIGRLPQETGLFTNDLVLLDFDDARRLLGLPEGYASDLAVDVHREEEQDAILADLTDAFDMPVTLTSRKETTGRYASSINRGRTLWAIALIPSVLAVCVLVSVNVRKSMGRQSDIGIMKSVGWTMNDIVRLQLYRHMFICIPSAAIGSCIAFYLVYWPGAHWISGFLLGWEHIPPKLYLEANGAFIVMMEVVGLMLAPIMVSALLQALRVSKADAYDLVEGRI